MSSHNQFPFGTMGVAGGPPPSFGYTFTSYSSLSAGLGSSLNNAQRTLDNSNAIAGDLILAFWAAGPGYAGQSSGTIRTPTFQVWSSTGGIIHFDSGVSSFVVGIQPRLASGDSEDDCLIFGQNFPIFLGCAIFGGSVWGGTLANITSDNENSQINNDNVNSMFRENGPPGGFAATVKGFLTAKQSAAAQSGETVSNTDQGIIALDTINVGDNGFDQGMVVGCGYKFEETAVDTPTGNYPLSGTWTGDVFSISSTFKSGDS